MDLQKLLFGTSQYISRPDTEANSPDRLPTPYGHFTDPDAKEVYTTRNNCSDWSRYPFRNHARRILAARGWVIKTEIRRLLLEGALADKGTYWYRSPHNRLPRAA